MKKTSILLLLILSLSTRAQNSTVTVSMKGIGDIKIGMKKAALEKLLNQPLPTPHLMKKDDEQYQDTVRVNHKGIEVDVIFQKEYSEDDQLNILVWEVKSSHPQLKTRSGIGIGDDKLKIVTTYQDYLMHIVPGYENDFKTKSKTQSTIWLFGDESNTVIVFHLTNNKLTGFSVMYNEGC